jgi:hypothetical protein
MPRKNNRDSRGIDWQHDDDVFRDITPAKIAVYKTDDEQVIILQGNNEICLGATGLGWLMEQLYDLAWEFGYEPPEPPRLPPPLKLIPRKANGAA